MTPADEFSLLADNAAEAGLAWSGPPPVRRESVAVAADRSVSALLWGSGPPQAVLLHGGAQNAHTWDTVALALGRPLVAVDLPGHGHSGWRDDHQYSPESMASDVAVALRRLAPHAQMVVGMSLGGLTALSLAVDHPDLVARLVLVDITPGTDAAKAEPILAFLAGPERFGSFQEILDRTLAFNPTRSVASLRRGVTHNARQFPDGSWRWRWDPSARWRSQSPGAARAGGRVRVALAGGGGVAGATRAYPGCPLVGRVRCRRGSAPAPSTRGHRRGGRRRRPQHPGRSARRPGPAPWPVPHRLNTRREKAIYSVGPRRSHELAGPNRK